MAVGNCNGKLKLVFTLSSAPRIQWSWGGVKSYYYLIWLFTVAREISELCLCFAGSKGNAPITLVLNGSSWAVSAENWLGKVTCSFFLAAITLSGWRHIGEAVGGILHLCLSGCICSWEKKKPSIFKAVNLVPPATIKATSIYFSSSLHFQRVYCKDVLTSKMPVR